MQLIGDKSSFGVAGLFLLAVAIGAIGGAFVSVVALWFRCGCFMMDARVPLAFSIASGCYFFIVVGYAALRNRRKESRK